MFIWLTSDQLISFELIFCRIMIVESKQSLFLKITTCVGIDKIVKLTKPKINLEYLFSTNCAWLGQ